MFYKYIRDFKENLNNINGKKNEFCNEIIIMSSYLLFDSKI